MKIMKVFNCQDMPEEIKRIFFELNLGTGNDCYVQWNPELHMEAEDEFGIEDEIVKKYKIVQKWLIDNGSAEDEEVLINHWW